MTSNILVPIEEFIQNLSVHYFSFRTTGVKIVSLPANESWPDDLDVRDPRHYYDPALDKVITKIDLPGDKQQLTKTSFSDLIKGTCDQLMRDFKGSFIKETHALIENGLDVSKAYKVYRFRVRHLLEELRNSNPIEGVEHVEGLINDILSYSEEVYEDLILEIPRQDDIKLYWRGESKGFVNLLAPFIREGVLSVVGTNHEKPVFRELYKTIFFHVDGNAGKRIGEDTFYNYFQEELRNTEKVKRTPVLISDLQK